ncbi:hypothetical protein CEQ90_02980 [Lewinellaceae bacterium SD302]|nr:hypothetical protein CEQ90_02980 [Lewinellaceae bacterium SD302]
MNQRSLGIVAILLLLALIGSLLWGFNRSAEVKTVTELQAQTSAELGEMEKLRDNLAAEVAGLSDRYESVVSTNEELQGQLTGAQQELRRVQNLYSKAINTNANDKEVAYEMRKQIEDLIMVRSDLERSIRVVSSQNDSLKSANTILRTQLGQSQENNRQLAAMTQQMESEIRDLTLKNFNATAFQIDALRRGGEKVTSRAGQARSVAVSFDLAGVPEKYQGVRPLYLVITDQAGTPIGGTNVIPVKATVNGQETNLKPVETKEVNIMSSQRINFVHELDDKLDAGFYRAQVFTDVGMLGGASFQLR